MGDGGQDGGIILGALVGISYGLIVACALGSVAGVVCMRVFSCTFGYGVRSGNVVGVVVGGRGACSGMGAGQYLSRCRICVVWV